MTSFLRVLAMSGVALCLLTGAPAQAETTGVIVVQGTTYLPGDTTGVVPLPVKHLRGNDLMLTNLDPLGAHSVTSEDYIPGTTRPLFDSDPVNFRASALVSGVAALPIGTYAFFCSIHGAMRGAIDVVG